MSRDDACRHDRLGHRRYILGLAMRWCYDCEWFVDCPGYCLAHTHEFRELPGGKSVYTRRRPAEHETAP